MEPIARDSVDAVADPYKVLCGSCPSAGFQQPVRLCGMPSQLLAALKSAAEGEEIVCKVSPTLKYRNSRTGLTVPNAILFQIWRVVEVRTPLGESILEFVSWGRTKSRRQRRKAWQERRK